MRINATIVVTTCRKHFRSETTPSIHVLLGLKPEGDGIRKPGAGMWVPSGGKRESSDKSLKGCARRENLEEFGFNIPLKKLRRVGLLVGFASRKEQKPMWTVAIYHTHLECEPGLTWRNEVWDDVDWFRHDKLPWKKMLPSDRKWLPGVLKNPRRKPFRHVVYLR